jgi:antitoxin component of MazEF toxin-antitoxin module
MTLLNLIAIDSELGVILPRELLESMKLGPGDYLKVSEAGEGYLLTPCPSESLKQLKAGREFMSSFEGVFRKLAD